MTLAERIYCAKTRWQISLVRIAFLLDLPLEEVAELYHQELDKTHQVKTTINLDDDISALGLPERHTNILRRRRIGTVCQALKLTKDDLLSIRNCGTQIAEAILARLTSVHDMIDAQEASGE